MQREQEGRFPGEWTSPLQGDRITNRMTDRQRNAVAFGLDGQRRCRCARQPEVQRKVDVLGGPTATTEVSAVQAEHRLNLARSRETDRGKWLRESIAGF